MNKKNEEEGYMGRLMEWNSKPVIFVACVASIFVGAS